MKFFVKLLMTFSLGIFMPITSKILLFTYSYNRPDFIEIQHKTFKKFLLDEYEFIVFNDATDQNLYNQINQICTQNNIRCIPIPQEIHDPIYNPSLRNCAVVNYSLKALGFEHDDIIALFDSDLFLIKEFSIREYLKGFDLAGQDQIRGDIHYLWIGLVFLNMATMPNKNTIDFGCGFIGNTNTDAGGFTHHYIKNNLTARVRYFDNVVYLTDFTCTECKNNGQICTHNFDFMRKYKFSNPLCSLAFNSRNSISEIYLNNTFLHYRAGTNWNHETDDYHQRKTQSLIHFINALLSEDIENSLKI